MDGPYSVGAVVLLAGVGVAALGGIGLTVLAWRRRNQPAATAFTLFALGHTLWCLSTLAHWLTDSFFLSQVGFYMVFTSATFSLVAWVVFTAQYTGYDTLVTGWVGRAFVGFVTAILLVILTNPLHGQYVLNLRLVSYGGLSVVTFDQSLLFFVVSAVVYGLVLYTYWLMYRFYRAALAGAKRQAGLILVADIFFAVATFGYFILGISVHPAIDPSPLFFGITVAIIAWALFYYDFLDVAPLAADLLFEKMQDPVIVVDEAGVVVERNEPAGRLGIDAGRELSALVPTIDSETAYPETITVTTDDERTFDVNVSPVSDHHDQQRGELIVLRDITAQRQKQQLLERQNERLDQFAGFVSHDLQNPLTVATLRLQLLREELPDADGPNEHAEIIDRNLDRMETMITELLRLARAETAVEELESVALCELAEEAWETTQTADASFRNEFDSEATVDGDGDLLLNMFENLFRNATAHNDQPVTITAGTFDDGAGIYVEDDGVGLDPAETETLFEFGETSSSGGTGFGLAIVRELVRAHGWSITATESAAGGARFEIVTE